MLDDKLCYTEEGKDYTKMVRDVLKTVIGNGKNGEQLHSN